MTRNLIVAASLLSIAFAARELTVLRGEPGPAGAAGVNGSSAGTVEAAPTALGADDRYDRREGRILVGAADMLPENIVSPPWSYTGPSGAVTADADKTEIHRRSGEVSFMRSVLELPDGAQINKVECLAKDLAGDNRQIRVDLAADVLNPATGVPEIRVCATAFSAGETLFTLTPPNATGDCGPVQEVLFSDARKPVLIVRMVQESPNVDINTTTTGVAEAAFRCCVVHYREGPPP